jgi:hypothetical protein
VAFDDIGRPAIGRADAKQLLDAQRQDQIRRQDQAARLEQEAVERDQAFRAALNPGIPWYRLPDGVSYGAAVQAEEAARAPRRVPSHGEWLFGETDTMTFHSMQGEGGDE